MPDPIEICLEDLDLSPRDDRYMRCVALPGGEPGLSLDREGGVRWMPDGPAAYELWVSLDDRLVLRRGDAGPITVSRGGRSVEAPTGKPVILVDGDVLLVSDRRLRVHVHGPTEAVFEPRPLIGAALARVALAAAAALAISAAVGAGADAAAQPGTAASGHQEIEVRDRPPEAPAMVPVTCAITSQTMGNKGQLQIHASCPAANQIARGARGHVLDPKTGRPMKNGAVVVRKVAGKKITASAQSKKPFKASKLRFYVDM